MTEYGTFIDSHVDLKTNALKQEEKALANELKTIYAIHEKAVEEYARQKALKERAYLSFAVIQDNTVPQHANKHLIGSLLCFITLALLFTRGFLRYREQRGEDIRLSQFSGFFSPWSLTVGIWILILGLYYLLDTDL